MTTLQFGRTNHRPHTTQCLKTCITRLPIVHHPPARQQSHCHAHRFVWQDLTDSKWLRDGVVEELLYHHLSVLMLRFLGMKPSSSVFLSSLDHPQSPFSSPFKLIDAYRVYHIADHGVSTPVTPASLSCTRIQALGLLWSIDGPSQLH